MISFLRERLQGIVAFSFLGIVALTFAFLGLPTFTQTFSKNNYATIGEYEISQSEYISTRNHKFRDKNKLISEQGYKNDSVLIGDNCWLAHGAVVTAGTRLQSGSIISANTVANKNESEPSIHKNMIEQIYIESDEF